MVRIQNQPVIAGSAEVSSEVFNGGSLCETGALIELGDLVSCIGDVASRALLGEVELSDDGAVVEPMIEGRR